MLRKKKKKKTIRWKKKEEKNVHLERYAPDIFSNSSSYAENK